MLFRRVQEHVKDQNWFAVAIDFFIVVLGVLIGLQAQGWMEGRKDRANYHLALERLEAELQENLKTIEGIEVSLADRLDYMSAGISALLSCEDADENVDAANRALLVATGTHGLKLRTTALRELTSTAELLSQQNEISRKVFSDLLYQIEVLSREGAIIEEYPLREPFETNPLVDILPLELREREYNQRTWISQRRPLALNVPISEACQNNDLIKSLYYWERWQGELNAITNVLTSEINASLDHISEL